MNFRDEHPFEHRCNESKKVRARYPTRLPVICERHAQTGASLPKSDKRKFLVPRDLSMAQFSMVIRKRLQIEASTALFLTTQNGILPPVTQQLHIVYDEHRDDDGFLYLHYSAENTFG